MSMMSDWTRIYLDSIPTRRSGLQNVSRRVESSAITFISWENVSGTVTSARFPLCKLACDLICLSSVELLESMSTCLIVTDMLFLVGETGNCEYNHGTRLTPAEQLVLKHKARSRSCPKGPACRDLDCTSGHQCKYAAKGCLTDNCWFKETHGMDMVCFTL